ncbi:aminotransferase class V-fold PLP-dependent enzyme [Victivallaceae bacterium BBE-744-WT-12]|uniref:Aminotransferase class V-fold PLP-dependent enzyme n=1 Tax=Victivallis lenta TaxID=2606640 RepID=A0A844G3G0_9BACT|nr:aminotransferase class V-fold PLP-dependent enzyme [Victivallis lenta]AVM46808.1 pyridoxal-dependent decarboxylase [Victivallales bacterium CCUG 44730]MST97896.1 aminotransferase class V-fold PLP-dependent enzyme [Victivallis lenta]HBP07303.1 aminotransferase class V-fold PLP-dependent enzyme [Lentisphaeria bacterium]HCH85211.1 aminotransferase class V-fold PLP-dependent enzyme [Lentisphaeria bacterium]
MKSVKLQKRPDEPVLRRMTETARKLVERQKLQMGYPFDQETNLTGFYEWLLETGLCNTTLISVGSPYKEAWDMLHVDEFEREVVDFVAGTFGFRGGHWGVVTNGGTDGNLHGIYFGRKTLEAKSELPPILYVSAEAHYSVQKLGDILRIETRIIGVHPTGQMDIEDFRRQLDPTRPALVAIAVGGTFKGAIDDQRAIDRVLKEVKPPACYRHLDVALFGGYLPWLDDPAARELVDQAAMGFDSLAVSGHKFFALNEPAGVFLCRKEILQHLTKLTVPYLGGIVMPTISCSRSGFDVLKLYWRIMTTGPAGFRAEANHVLAMTAKLLAALAARGVEAHANPWSNTVYFRRPREEVVHRCCMACSGEFSHVVVMQYFDEELVERLADEIAG